MVVNRYTLLETNSCNMGWQASPDLSLICSDVKVNSAMHPQDESSRDARLSTVSVPKKVTKEPSLCHHMIIAAINAITADKKLLAKFTMSLSNHLIPLNNALSFPDGDFFFSVNFPESASI